MYNREAMSTNGRSRCIIDVDDVVGMVGKVRIELNWIGRLKKGKIKAICKEMQ